MGNDHAETILQALHLLGPDPVEDEAELHEGQLHGYEALRLLVAERDEARMGERGWKATAETYLANCEAAEAALNRLIAVSTQYLDTGRGDLDGAIDLARRTPTGDGGIAS
jgi:hypothetical protein